MPEVVTGSTVPRRQLGRYLRDLRNRARITVRLAAETLEWSDTKIWRIETGQTSMRSLDVEAMCRVYGARPDITRALMGLAKETKARGWWHSYGDVIPEGFNVYIGLEEAATRIDWYQSDLVPGLFQTEDYARHVISTGNPGMSEPEIDRRVHVRMARQPTLTRVTAPAAVLSVISEAVLRRPIGGGAAMTRQLERLIEFAELPNVSIRIVPFQVGLHFGVMSGPFEILHFPTTGNGHETEPPTVFIETLTGSLYLDKPEEIDHYTSAFTNIWESALDERASRELISHATKELET